MAGRACPVQVKVRRVRRAAATLTVCGALCYADALHPAYRIRCSASGEEPMGVDLRRLGAIALVIGTVLAPHAGHARESGIQRTPDQARVLVSKDVGGVRYA